MSVNKQLLRGTLRLTYLWNRAKQKESEHKRHLRRAERRGSTGSLASVLREAKTRSTIRV